MLISALVYEIFDEENMSNEDEQNYFIPHRRTFHIQTIPQWKISLSDDRANVEINRIFLPIESNVLSEKLIEIQSSSNEHQSIEHAVKYFCKFPFQIFLIYSPSDETSAIRDGRFTNEKSINNECNQSTTN